MTTILVVDDNAIDRRLAGGLLMTGLADPDRPGAVAVLYAADGREALDVMRGRLPDLVLTDLQMPGMTGLELVEAVRDTYPGVPVVLMTAHGSEEVAARALRRGAASYVPKAALARDLAETVEGILVLTREAQEERRALGCLTRSEAHFVLGNDLALVPPLVRHAHQELRRFGVCDEAAALRVTVALREALVNAIEHGNLEVSSDLKDADPAAFHRRADERRAAAPYRDRRVEFVIRGSPDETVYVIRDGGPGFDPATLPDPTDPASLERAHGRGLLLIRTFMDEVRHNPAGNEITLVKRREPAGPGAAASD